MHDDENCRYISRNRTIKLTYSENHLLQVLIRNKGKVCNLSYREVFNLRKKLKGEVEIKTKRGRGYYIDC